MEETPAGEAEGQRRGVLGRGGGRCGGWKGGEGIRIYEEKFPPHPPTLKKKEEKKKKRNETKKTKGTALLLKSGRRVLVFD